MGLTTTIANTISFITPTTVSFPAPSLITTFIATAVSYADLIKAVPPLNPHINHDPVTLAPKGLLLEESRTNVLIRNNAYTQFV